MATSLRTQKNAPAACYGRGRIYTHSGKQMLVVPAVGKSRSIYIVTLNKVAFAVKENWPGVFYDRRRGVFGRWTLLND